METTIEDKKLPKHISAAVSNLEKQIEKYQLAIIKQTNKIDDATAAVKGLEASISALSEQITKLKG